MPSELDSPTLRVRGRLKRGSLRLDTEVHLVKFGILGQARAVLS
jgi:hypothetical protein